MLIKLPPKTREILEEKDERGRFLRSLDQRLHYTNPVTITPNIGGKPLQAFTDHYHEEQKISAEELEKVLELIGDETGLALNPTNTAMGFKVGFEVVYIDKNRRDSLLMFIEEQLPEGYDFDRLSETFMREDNVRRLTRAGLERPKANRGCYEY